MTVQRQGTILIFGKKEGKAELSFRKLIISRLVIVGARG